MTNKVSEVKINSQIVSESVRVIDTNGNQLGIIPTSKAIKIAQSKDLDLVEVSPNADPPVCKIVDYKKFLYEQEKKQKEAKKKSKSLQTKEVKFSPSIDTHDFQFKARHAKKFLEDGHSVRASVEFKGRQNLHKEFGEKVLKDLIEECNEVGVVEKPISVEGRFMLVFLKPRKKN